MGVDKPSWLRRAWRRLCTCQIGGHEEDLHQKNIDQDSESSRETIITKTMPTTTSTSTSTIAVPTEQQRINRQLQLHEGNKQFELTTADLPELQHPDEVLVAVKAIGLNPIDWKSVAYGFGIPSWPFVSGREFVGKVTKKSNYDKHSDSRIGDVVLVVSTDYRDYRKAAFQKFAIAWDYNILRIPPQIPTERVAGVGVAFVAAAFSLGICLGAKFPSTDCETGLDLLLLARSQPKHSIPEDVRDEVFQGIQTDDRIQEGDWVVIYGASAIAGQMAIQLAKLAGLRVIAVADSQRHQERLSALGAHEVVDRHNLDAAAERVNEVTGGSVRYAIDTVGKKTADWSYRILRDNATRQTESQTEHKRSGHLVGLSGVPKEMDSLVHGHTLPIKLFHTNAVLGRAVMSWLEELLKTGKLQLPEVEVINGSLEKVNEGLDRLKRGEASGKRIIVTLSEDS